MSPLAHSREIRSVRELRTISKGHYSSLIERLRSWQNVAQPHLIVGFSNPGVKSVAIKAVNSTNAIKTVRLLASTHRVSRNNRTQGRSLRGNTV
jgi:hypothetical protein